jgi:hypothetical protein
LQRRQVLKPRRGGLFIAQPPAWNNLFVFQRRGLTPDVQDLTKASFLSAPRIHHRAAPLKNKKKGRVGRRVL